MISFATCFIYAVWTLNFVCELARVEVSGKAKATLITMVVRDYPIGGAGHCTRGYPLYISIHKRLEWVTHPFHVFFILILFALSSSTAQYDYHNNEWTKPSSYTILFSVGFHPIDFVQRFTVEEQKADISYPSSPTFGANFVKIWPFS